jgi:enterochelin esterase family protein
MKLLTILVVPMAFCLAQSQKAEEFATAAGTVRLTPIQHAAVMLEGGGKVIYVDPAQGNFDALPKADLILITHTHPDHLAPANIDRLKKDGTLILAPEAVVKTLPAAQVMRNGDMRRWEAWSIEAVAAYNLKRGPAAGQFYHEKGTGNGYVLGYGGKRFYISGDTEGTPEMAALKNIDVALVCMNVPYTMPPEEAAEAIKTFRPKVVIPYHYQGSDLALLEKGLAGSGIELRLLNWYPNGQGSPGGRGGAGGRGSQPAAEGAPGGRGGAAAAPVQPGPQVLPDLRVTFRLNAPKAAEVQVSGDFSLQQNATQAMQKNDQGMWSLTTGPLLPDIYSYWFIVDGIPIPDPGNGWIKPGVRTTQSVFEVPGVQSDWDALKDVPHGDVRIVWHHSTALEKMRRMHVYLPPGYDASRDRYPVVYLLHGGGDTDDGWVSIGRVNFILDNLIAQGKAKPMIVVMPFVFAAAQGTPEYANNPALFAKDLFQDVIPYVEKNFRAAAGPENRAFGGLSVPNILPDVAFPNLDKFNYLFFTGNGLNDDRIAYYEKQLPGVLDNPANVKRIKVWIGDGVSAMTFAGSKNLADNLKKRGYDATFFMMQGIHGWPYFRREFYEFAQVAFR